MHKKRVWKSFWDSRKLSQAHEKCAMKIKQRNKKKQRAPKIFFDGRKEFIRCVRKTRAMDIKQLQVNDPSYIEGTTYLFSKRVNRCQGDGFSSVGAQTGAINLVLRISGVNFLHCWVTDSICTRMIKKFKNSKGK